MKFSRHEIKFDKFVSSPPVHATFCVDCLSELYGEPIETVSAYLRGAGILSYPAHCRHCGEHKDTFTGAVFGLAQLAVFLECFPPVRPLSEARSNRRCDTLVSVGSGPSGIRYSLESQTCGTTTAARTYFPADRGSVTGEALADAAAELVWTL
jgi:hypothetical protein